MSQRAAALVVLAVVVSLAPISAAAEECSICFLPARPAEMSGNDPVFTVQTAGHAWRARTFVLDLDGLTLEGTFANDRGGHATISGTLDPDTYAFTGRLNGTEAYSWDDGAGKRTSSFSGTWSAELTEIGSTVSARFVRGWAVPQSGASGEPFPVALNWRGPVEVVFESFAYEPGSYRVESYEAHGISSGSSASGSLGLTAVGGVLARDYVVPARVQIVSVDGDVEMARASDGRSYPATTGSTVSRGDAIITGYDSRAVLDLGGGTVVVPPLTHLRIDDALLSADTQKLQLYLYAGSVKVRLDRPASIRGDFSVTTPGAYSSIRGSEMIVSYDEATGATTVVVTDHEAFVKGNADASERRIAEGQQVTVDPHGRSGEPTVANGETADAFGDAGSSDGPTGNVFWVLLALAAIGTTAAVVWQKRRAPP